MITIFVLILAIIAGIAIIYLSVDKKENKKDNFDYKNTDIYQELKDINIKQEKILDLKNQVNKYIYGLDNLVNGIIIAILANSHILVEGVPGVAKTRTILVFSKLLGLDFKRIQFTPDLLPSDIIGGEIYNKNIGKFEIYKGPIFTNLLLADEINRATPKVQSALLEAMQEKKVTIGNQTFTLPEPFFVMATQNPIEQEGTFVLPEAQMDRFLFKITVSYPAKEIEKKVIFAENEQLENIQPFLDANKIIEYQQQINKVSIPEKVQNYIVNIVDELRKPDENIQLGPSPRGTIALAKAAKAIAWLEERNKITVDDVKKVILPVLRHRIKLTYKALSDNKSPEEIIINKVINVSDW